jgi:hypothetical protein
VSGDEPVEALLRRGIADRRRRRDAWLTALRGGLVPVVDSQQLDRQRLGAAAVLGAMAAGTSPATLVRALDRILPRTRSALTATALLGGAAALAAAAREELRRIGSLVPSRPCRASRRTSPRLPTPPPPAEASGRELGLQRVRGGRGAAGGPGAPPAIRSSAPGPPDRRWPGPRRRAGRWRHGRRVEPHVQGRAPRPPSSGNGERPAPFARPGRTANHVSGLSR